MEVVLKELGLSELCYIFEREKVTPDIIPKLSNAEFKELGISNRQTMMDLRVKCTLYGSSKPQIEENNWRQRGAPRFQIPQNVLSDLVNDGFKIKETATLLGVSERTIYRRLSTYNIKVRDFSVISDELLDQNLFNLCQKFPNCGERFFNEML